MEKIEAGGPCQNPQRQINQQEQNEISRAWVDAKQYRTVDL